MKLLLFDIDGTLLHANGSGRRAVARALADVCGRRVVTDGVTFSGKTDPQILREVLHASGVPEVTDALVDAAVDAYTEAAAATLDPADVTPLPGAARLVRALAARDDVQLALLTGNVERMAYEKLAAIGLEAYFPFGAFGSDDADRNRLPALAVARARAHTGHPFVGAETVIIGDTARDIRCGRGIGAMSVAVCTGRYARADLAPHGPHLLLDDLTDVSRFVQAVVLGRRATA
jgi:phosphoglycolate phosphatase-like HAD superfamily hydrolase